VYVPPIKQSVMLSQYHQRNSEPDESLVGYNFDTNSWDVIDVGGNFHTESMPEGGESQGYFGFDSNNNTIVYHCCTSGSNQSEDINHDWWYDVLGQSGRDKHTSPKPPDVALLPGGIFDPAHNVFIFHGGASFVGTWAYDPVGNSWVQMHPTGSVPDPSLALAGVAYSTAQQKVYLFGGQSETSGVYTNDLYVYDYSTNTWTLITPAGGIKPPGRNAHAFAYDSTNNIFLTYGGANSSGLLNDTWVYDPAANTWTQVTTPGPGATNVAVYAKMSYDSTTMSS
jgi:N-acetylneuraminic acid mutarotase